MVDQFKIAVLNATSVSLESGTKSDQLVGRYVNELSSKRYKAFLERTKFEAFIWHLSKGLGKQYADDLLYRIYACAGKQYGPNHAAISFLLSKGVCQLCLTTNFDNAIELSCGGLELAVEGWDYQPNSPLDDIDRPMLIKLHGDAITKTCVATSPELSQAKLLERYSFLQDVLKGKNVLVVGYSGTGDIDIAPQLRKVDAKLFWCNHSANAFPQIHQRQISVLCDLSLRTGKHASSNTSRRNLLLELAEIYGWQDTWEGHERNWKAELRDWGKRINNDGMRKSVVSLFGVEKYWQRTHIAYYKHREEDTETSQLELAESLALLAAYKSAHKSLTELLQRTDLQ